LTTLNASFLEPVTKCVLLQKPLSVIEGYVNRRQLSTQIPSSPNCETVEYWHIPYTLYQILPKRQVIHQTSHDTNVILMRSYRVSISCMTVLIVARSAHAVIVVRCDSFPGWRWQTLGRHRLPVHFAVAPAAAGGGQSTGRRHAPRRRASPPAPLSPPPGS